MAVLKLRQFRVLTFDCYGTLVDWETGILAGLRPVLRQHGVNLTDEAILECYGQYEAESQVPRRINPRGLSFNPRPVFWTIEDIR